MSDTYVLCTDVGGYWMEWMDKERERCGGSEGMKYTEDGGGGRLLAISQQ